MCIVIIKRPEVHVFADYLHDYLLITQRRSVAKSVGCFQRRLFVCLFVCLFVNMITSERVNVG